MCVSQGSQRGGGGLGQQGLGGKACGCRTREDVKLGLDLGVEDVVVVHQADHHGAVHHRVKRARVNVHGLGVQVGGVVDAAQLVVQLGAEG